MRRPTFCLLISVVVFFVSCSYGLNETPAEEDVLDESSRGFGDVTSSGSFVVGEGIEVLSNGNWLVLNQYLSGPAEIRYSRLTKSFRATLSTIDGRESSVIHGEYSSTWDEYSISGTLPALLYPQWRDINYPLKVVKYDATTRKCYIVGKQGTFWDGISYRTYYVGIVFKK